MIRVKMEWTEAQLERLRALIVKNSERIPFGGCWIWTGSIKRNQSGMEYGRVAFRIHGEFCKYRTHPRSWSAHVVSRIVHDGGVKCIGWVVAHTCHNPLCVNPDHLVYCTQKDNMQMSVRAGRLKRKAA